MTDYDPSAPANCGRCAADSGNPLGSPARKLGGAAREIKRFVGMVWTRYYEKHFQYSFWIPIARSMV